MSAEQDTAVNDSTEESSKTADDSHSSDSMERVAQDLEDLAAAAEKSEQAATDTPASPEREPPPESEPKPDADGGEKKIINFLQVWFKIKS